MFVLFLSGFGDENLKSEMALNKGNKNPQMLRSQARIKYKF
jgi:hypothetical protein